MDSGVRSIPLASSTTVGLWPLTPRICPRSMTRRSSEDAIYLGLWLQYPRPKTRRWRKDLSWSRCTHRERQQSRDWLRFIEAAGCLLNCD